MPTYEYRCPEGHEFELFQKMSDDPVATCPECGKEAERLLSAGGGFVFKGEGFYITDYKRKDEARKREREAKRAEGGAEKKGADDAAASGAAGGSSSEGASGGKGSPSSSGDGSGGKDPSSSSSSFSDSSRD